MAMDVAGMLRRSGVHPSAQRVAVAEYVLGTDEHPSADEVWARVKRRFPMISRATVYNTLNLFEKKGLIKGLSIAEGKMVFDPKTEPHHHYDDEATGRIYDLPWKSLEVKNVGALQGYSVDSYQVVLRGRKK